MKRNYLLPNVFKRVGLWMSVPFFAVCVWLLLGDMELDVFSVPVLSLAGWDSAWFEVTATDPVNEIAMLGLLVSLCFIALSREKDEDEMTGMVRMQSFVWSFWVTVAVLAFGIVFLYDLVFLSFSFAAIYIVFIVYIIKFNLTMNAIRRVGK